MNGWKIAHPVVDDEETAKKYRMVILPPPTVKGVYAGKPTVYRLEPGEPMPLGIVVAYEKTEEKSDYGNKPLPPLDQDGPIDHGMGSCRKCMTPMRGQNGVCDQCR